MCILRPVKSYFRLVFCVHSKAPAYCGGFLFYPFPRNFVYLDMAYDKDKIYKQALKVLEANKKVVFVKQLVARLPVSVPTFYELFNTTSEEFNTLKDLLDENKVRRKEGLMDQWEDPSASASLQISLFKLLADDEELQRLNNERKSDQSEQPTIKIENYIPLTTDNAGNDIN